MKKPIIIAVALQKGGVGKTTSAINIAAGLTALGKEVAIIDCDPQRSASIHLGAPNEKEVVTISNMLDIIMNEFENESEYDFSEYILTNHEGLQYIPAAEILAGTENAIAATMTVPREQVLKLVLSKPEFEVFDFIVLDCPPSLGLLMVNALTCADRVIIPIAAEQEAVDAVEKFLNTLGRVKKNFNPILQIEGVVITKKYRTKNAEECEQNIRSTFGEVVYTDVMEYLNEATEHYKQNKAMVFNEESRLGKKYLAIANSIIENNKK